MFLLGFIVVAACVMTFEARDSAAKVVPARFKMSTTGPPPGVCPHSSTLRSGHGSLRTAGSQTAGTMTSGSHHGHHGSLHGTHHSDHHRHHGGHHHASDRHALTQSFVQFSRGLALESKKLGHRKNIQGSSPSGTRSNSLKVPQGSINRSPSAPDLVLEKVPPTGSLKETLPNHLQHAQKSAMGRQTSRRTFAACALLNPGLLHRHAVSVDETAANYRSNDSLQQGTGSQGSMAMDLHLESVTLRVRDKRRNPLKRQRKIEEDEQHNQSGTSRRNSHSCSPRLPGQYGLRDNATGGSAQYLPNNAGYNSYNAPKRRSSNASDCTHRSRSRKREHNSCHHARGKLERAISSDSRLTGAVPKCYHSYEPSRNNSTEQDSGAMSTSEGDIRKSHQVMVHFSPTTEG